MQFRQHRRKLLFPPGLLALAGLLWLGCVEVGRWQEKLTKKVVIRLTMPVYPSRNEKPTIRFELPDPDTVCRSCSWSNAYFTGSPSTDRREQIQVEKSITNIMVDSAHGNGVRIQFSSTSRYRNLISVLNILEKEKVKKFWLDIYHVPVTLYAFNEPPRPADPSVTVIDEFLLCGDVVYGPPPLPPLVPFWVRFEEAVAEFWRFAWMQPLWQPEWRTRFYLLVLLATLSGWRIVRAWRAA